MQTTEQPGYRIAEAERPLWLGQTPAGWADAVRTVDPNDAHDAASMIAAAALGWTVEQCPLEAVLPIHGEGYATRAPLCRVTSPTSAATRARVGCRSR
jgi:hypothetical protein